MNCCTTRIETYKNWTVRTIVQRTKTHCLINWSILVLLLFSIIGFELITLHDLLINDFLISSETDVSNFFAFNDALLQSAETLGETQNVGFRNEESFVFGTFILYEVENGQEFFTVANLQAICEVEALYVTEPDYPLYCRTSNANGLDTTCGDQTATVSSLFYGPEETDCPPLDQDFLDGFKANLPNIEALAGIFDDLENTKVARSTLTVGTPLGSDTPPNVNFSSASSDPFSAEAVDGHTPFQVEYSFTLFDYFGLNYNLPFENPWNRDFFTSPVKDATVQIRVYSILVDQAHLDDVIAFDSLLIGGSFFFVLIFVWVYVGSFFLAITAMFSVSLSMVVGIFLYAGVLQVDYFTTLHTVSFFIILAVGANNFYVISDAWKQSEDIVDNDSEGQGLVGKETRKLEETDVGSKCEEDILIARLDYAYTRAALSVFNTSMTTFIAFVANLISPISVIAGFGLFSGIVVLVNFVFMLNIHPTHIIFYYKYVKPLNCCCGGKHQLSDDNETQDETLVEANDKEEELKEKSDGKCKNYLLRFRDGYIHLVLNTYFPYISFIFMAIISTVFVSFASRLQTPTTIEQVYPNTYMFTGFLEEFNNLFAGGAESTFTEVQGVFGISGVDDGDVKFLDRSQFRGTAIFDDEFDFTLQTTQDFIIDYCDRLPEIECFEGGCTINKLVLEETISCTVKDFRAFFLEATGTDESFVTRANGTSTGLDNEGLIAQLDAFLETPIGGAQSSNIGIINGQVKYVAVRFRQSMRIDQPLLIKEPVLKIFNDEAARVNSESPEGTGQFYHTSFDFVWQHIELGLVTGLFTGIAVSLGLSYLIVLFGTRHFVVSLFAISGVALIVACVLGTVQTFGYELGVTEVIAGVMVIGLAVDYSVHLGYMFTAARLRKISYEGDEEKTQIDLDEKDIKNADMIRYSIEKMMFTIMAGGATTIGAGLVLFGCTLSFFIKMGVLIMFTALYSLIFAFLYFVPLLRILGPGKK